MSWKKENSMDSEIFFIFYLWYLHFSQHNFVFFILFLISYFVKITTVLWHGVQKSLETKQAYWAVLQCLGRSLYSVLSPVLPHISMNSSTCNQGLYLGVSLLPQVRKTVHSWQINWPSPLSTSKRLIAAWMIRNQGWTIPGVPKKVSLSHQQ